MCLPTTDLRKEILDHISQTSDAHFKSQQIGDPELTLIEKRGIAEDILNRSVSLFLSRFGDFLTYEQIEFFRKSPEEDQYIVKYYLEKHKQKKPNVNSKTVRNRRFEAMKQLIDEGSYFSESEMKSRNPLLYEQLVGQYLTPDEKEEVNRINTSNMTFVKVLLTQIDKDNEETLKQEQLEEEEKTDSSSLDEERNSKKTKIPTRQFFSQDDVEYDSSDEEHEESNKMQQDDVDHDSFSQTLSSKLWGEEMSDKPLSTPVGMGRASYATPSGSTYSSAQQQKSIKNHVPISGEEKRLLFKEFQSQMFTDFLEGHERLFDYSKVDSNPAYDDLNVNTQEAEEKYFDESDDVSSSSEMQVDAEDGDFKKKTSSPISSEDELDVFMNNLKPQILLQDINSRMKHL